MAIGVVLERMDLISGTLVADEVVVAAGLATTAKVLDPVAGALASELLVGAITLGLGAISDALGS